MVIRSPDKRTRNTDFFPEWELWPAPLTPHHYRVAWGARPVGEEGNVVGMRSVDVMQAGDISLSKWRLTWRQRLWLLFHPNLFVHVAGEHPALSITTK